MPRKILNAAVSHLPINLPSLKVKFKAPRQNIVVHDSQSSYNLFRHYWDKSIFIQEKVYAIFMNNARVLHGCKKLASGTYRSCDFDESLLYGIALSSRSTKIILAHNHTTGKIHPSERDKIVTERIKDGCELLGIKLVDHIIMGFDSFFSFSDNDLIL